MRSHSPRGMAWVCSRLPGFLPHVQIVYTLTLSISRREMGAVGDLVRLYTITHLTPGNISCHGQVTVLSLHTRISDYLVNGGFTSFQGIDKFINARVAFIRN